MGTEQIELRELDGAVELDVWVHPRSRKPEVGGTHGGALRVRIGAPPIEGRANESLRVALAKALSVRRVDVSLVSGERGRRKRVRIQGRTDDLRRRLQVLVEHPEAV